jgi:multidrug resistance efflux pump
MIAFLTICYCALLWVLVKLRVLKPTLPVKLSPIAFILILLIVLFIPMMYGAPSGQLVTYGEVIQIVPRVSGRLVEVPVQTNMPVKKGDVLFKIDPEPYRAEVDRLEAALAEAEQAVPQLKAEMDRAEADLARTKALRDLAKIAFEKTSSLVKVDALRRVQIDKATADLKSAEASVLEAEAGLEKARLAYQSEIHGENTTVALRRAELAKGKIDLRETTVYAPTDGFVVYQALRPGFVVGRMPQSTVMSFVPSDQVLIALISQNHLRYVQANQSADLVTELYPGQVFNAKVVSVVKATGLGQLSPSGQMPEFVQEIPRGMFPVRLKLMEEEPKRPLYVGSIGTAAIYTDRYGFTHIIRRVMIRMEAWLNYLF